MIKAIVQTRLLFWKKQWKGLTVLLIFPLMMTFVIMYVIGLMQDDVKVPVGIVLEDDSILANQLYESIEMTPYIRPYLLRKHDALHKLEKQQLDSVFIIKNGYADNIEKGRQHNLIEGYESNVSFAYVPLKELVVSYVYGDFTRSRAAFVVKDLQKAGALQNIWDWESLVERSKQIEQEQDLLTTTLTFGESKQDDAETMSLIDPWTIWVLLTFLATFFLFDWVIKENRQSIQRRLSFSKLLLKQYLTLNMLLYTVFLLIIDIITVILLSVFFSFSLSFVLILTIISYRFTLNMFAFLISLHFQMTYVYYVMSLLLFSLITIWSGAIVPNDGLISRFPLLIYVNPLEPVFSFNLYNHWFILACLLFSLWFYRREKYDA